MRLYSLSDELECPKGACSLPAVRLIVLLAPVSLLKIAHSLSVLHQLQSRLLFQKFLPLLGHLAVRFKLFTIRFDFWC